MELLKQIAHDPRGSSYSLMTLAMFAAPPLLQSACAIYSGWGLAKHRWIRILLALFALLSALVCLKGNWKIAVDDETWEWRWMFLLPVSLGSVAIGRWCKSFRLQQ